MMLIRRKAPLETCPNLDCVRGGQCRARLPERECRKFHMTMDERRHELAAQLEAFNAEFRANNPGHVPRKLSDEESRYELRKAVVQACIEAGVPGAAAKMPPANPVTAEQLRQYREGTAPKGGVETAPLDRPEGSS